MSAAAGKYSPDTNTNGVILLGENHDEDLGKAISEALDEFLKVHKMNNIIKLDVSMRMFNLKLLIYDCKLFVDNCMFYL